MQSHAPTTAVQLYRGNLNRADYENAMALIRDNPALVAETHSALSRHARSDDSHDDADMDIDHHAVREPVAHSLRVSPPAPRDTAAAPQLHTIPQHREPAFDVSHIPPSASSPSSAAPSTTSSHTSTASGPRRDPLLAGTPLGAPRTASPHTQIATTYTTIMVNTPPPSATFSTTALAVAAGAAWLRDCHQ